MIADVSADGHQYPQPPWLAMHRLVERCTCHFNDDPCIVHGRFSTPMCAKMCAARMVREQAGHGVEVDAVAEPPEVLAVWTETRFCPHGRRFWVQPTPDQVSAWQVHEGGY